MSLLKMAIKLSLNAGSYYRGLDEVQSNTQKVALTLNNTFGRVLSARFAMKFAKEITSAIDSIPEHINKQFAEGKKPSLESQAAAEQIENSGWFGNSKVSDEWFNQFGAGAKILWNSIIDHVAAGFMNFKRGYIIPGHNSPEVLKMWAEREQKLGSQRSAVRPDELETANRRRENEKLKREELEKKRKADDLVKAEQEKAYLSTLTDAQRVKYHVARRMMLQSIGANQGDIAKETESISGLLGDLKTVRALGLNTSRRMDSSERAASIMNSPQAVVTLQEAARDFMQAVETFKRTTDQTTQSPYE